MANCQYCKSVLSNNKAIAYRCTNCGTVWCANGVCSGSSGKKQSSRNPKSLCLTCQKTDGIVKV
jgi:hypothetical protein